MNEELKNLKGYKYYIFGDAYGGYFMYTHNGLHWEPEEWRRIWKRESGQSFNTENKQFFALYQTLDQIPSWCLNIVTNDTDRLLDQI